eukprot:CAMPEP_0197433926 /NCGR_PEP_ID=MMETSP1175-20131217/1736_1 /TAXON_ID=1003142 /ORGANISM="Triceratium dubium, Strain CCMP147" /LENGTH=47 /DNA_ID= /DNA_START= /DNA_END= /DNA_ORIENTATION=
MAECNPSLPDSTIADNLCSSSNVLDTSSSLVPDTDASVSYGPSTPLL